MSAENRILLFTGDGKGKTSAALGAALRACGHDMAVLILQFIKAAAKSGEIAACKHLPGAVIEQMGLGFVPPPDSPRFEKHVMAAKNGMIRAAEALQSEAYRVVVLDEICVAVNKGLLSECEVVDTVHKSAGNKVVILTGRDASDGLLALADTATEMRLLKHGMANGIPAQEGVEF